MSWLPDFSTWKMPWSASTETAPVVENPSGMGSVDGVMGGRKKRRGSSKRSRTYKAGKKSKTSRRTGRKSSRD